MTLVLKGEPCLILQVCIELYAKRNMQKGFAFSRDDEMQTHYGILRSYLKRSRAHSKTLFFVEEEETIAKIEQIITDTLGDLNEPDIGFMFIQDVVRMVGGSKAKKN